MNDEADNVRVKRGKRQSEPVSDGDRRVASPFPGGSPTVQNGENHIGNRAKLRVALDVTTPEEATGVDDSGGQSPPLVTPNGMTRFLPWKRAELADSKPSTSNNAEKPSSPSLPLEETSSAMAFVKKAYATGSDYGKKMLPRNKKDQNKIRHSYSLSRQGSSAMSQDQGSPLSLKSAESSLNAADVHVGVQGENGVEDKAKVERTVLFNDGSSYSGEWRGKHIDGRGVFMWANGDRYEGEWRNDVQHGSGTYAAADGSMYYGGWKNGVKDGEGVYKPSTRSESAGDAEPRLHLRRYEDGVLVKETVLSLAKETKGKLKLKQEKHRQKHEAARKKKEEIERPLKPGEVCMDPSPSRKRRERARLDSLTHSLTHSRFPALCSPDRSYTKATTRTI